MGKYPLTYRQFKSIYSKVPRFTVELIVKTPEGIILTKRAIPPYVGSWHIPGGTVYYRETPEDALKRVAKGELGIEVEIVRFLGFIDYHDHHKISGWDWPIGAAYLCSVKKGKPKGSEQGEEIGYFKSVPEAIVPSQGQFLQDHVFQKKASRKT